MADDLLVFLNARLDEDATEIDPGVCGCLDANHVPSCVPTPWKDRPRREVAAKRGLVAYAFKLAAEIDGEWGCGCSATVIAADDCERIDPNQDEILRHVAAVYSDHPDYRPEWALSSQVT